jgi:hypothetical protein
MKDAGKPCVTKVYPPRGSGPEDGHAFGYFGFAVWGDDVIQFLGEHCRG